MKKILSICTVAAGLVALTSCSDFLEQESATDLTPGKTYSSTTTTGYAVNQIYCDLTKDRTYSQDWAILYGLGTDCELVDGLGDNAKASSERGYFNYNTGGEYTKVSDMWTEMFATIEDCNNVISGIKGSAIKDETAMQHYLGEAKCLRAMVYLDLIRAFGDIPMKLEPSKQDLSNVYMGKTDRDVILDSLLLDVESAVDELPWAGEEGYTTEHVTKGYAHALAAQIALTRAGYAIRENAKNGYETASYSDDTYPTQRPDEATRTNLYKIALSHLSAIIKSGKHNLNPSFKDEWYLLNQLKLDQTYQENIFELPMQQNVSGELGYTAGYRLNKVTTQWGYTNSSGKLKLTAPLFYSYDKEDQRRDITCATTQIVAENKSYEKNGKKITDKTYAVESALGNTPWGIYCGKWDPRMENESWLQQNLAAGAKHLTGINVVKVRYSQILLWYAEVLNELAGPTGSYEGDAGITAKDALALVHNRAFATPQTDYIASVSGNKDNLFNAIVNENAWELAGEGARKWDLIRWNLLHDKIWEMKQNYRTMLNEGKYPTTVYFNYIKDENGINSKIDVASMTWYETPARVDAYEGNASSMLKYDKNQSASYMTSICSGLVGTDSIEVDKDITVKNRYLVPIGSTTISSSNGKLSNSYGFSF